LTRSSVSARIQSPRLRLPAQPTSVADPDDVADWTAALVIDRSPGGLALRLDRPIPVGEILLVWLDTMSGPESWLPVQVRHCRQDESGWVVGVEFIAETAPGWTVGG
jgi:hypothetical protein